MPEAIVVESVGKVIVIVENIWGTFNALLPRRTTSECLASPQHSKWVILRKWWILCLDAVGELDVRVVVGE